MKDALQGREILFEITPMGSGYVKIVAMDTVSLTEITLQGPASASPEQLKNNALKRLVYVLRKKGLIA